VNGWNAILVVLGKLGSGNTVQLESGAFGSWVTRPQSEFVRV
jgi:hypothetical protein